MNPSYLNLQSELPESIPLLRYLPERVGHPWNDWDPSHVFAPCDLPPYLIFGPLDPSSFRKSLAGWSARWQGAEQDTYFDITYRADATRWEIHQSWCGLHAQPAVFPAHEALDKVIERVLQMPFPSHWDRASKASLEKDYQLTVIETRAGHWTFCGIPDGTFRTIILPVAVHNLRVLTAWINDVVNEATLQYPVTVQAKLLLQTVSSVEGRAPAWTAQDDLAFQRSVVETGLAPEGLPSRETLSDGAVARTLRRRLYFLFVEMPFAGLTDFLGRCATGHGPIRTSADAQLRFEWRPVVVPAMYELQTESLGLWDVNRTTRSLLQFITPGEESPIPTPEQALEAESGAAASLAKAEAISSNLMDSMGRT